MLMKKTVVITLLVASPALAADLDGLYLGQKPPGKTPELFAPGIVSKKNSKEHCLAVSPKGDEMFFTTEENFQKTRDHGPAPKQWPYSFEVDPIWKPVVVKAKFPCGASAARYC